MNDKEVENFEKQIGKLVLRGDGLTDEALTALALLSPVDAYNAGLRDAQTVLRRGDPHSSADPSSFLGTALSIPHRRAR